jgi:hypothetical protein
MVRSFELDVDASKLAAFLFSLLASLLPVRDLVDVVSRIFSLPRVYAGPDLSAQVQDVVYQGQVCSTIDVCNLPRTCIPAGLLRTIARASAICCWDGRKDGREGAGRVMMVVMLKV